MRRPRSTAAPVPIALAPIALALAGCAARPPAASPPLAPSPPPLAVTGPQVGNSRELREEFTRELLPEGWVGAVTLAFGGRFLADSTLDAVDDQPHFELDLEAGDAEYPFRWQIGFHYSDDDATVDDPMLGPTKSKASVFETTVGGLLLLDLGQSLVPYAGAFGSVVYVDGELVQGGAATSDSDVSVGASWRAGARLMLSRYSSVGVDVRQLLLTDLELGSLPVDADGWVVALTFGTVL